MSVCDVILNNVGVSFTPSTFKVSVSFIETMLSMSNLIWKIQMTLSNRDPLKYRMLIGRQALKNKVLIDPSLSCNQKKYTKEQRVGFYKAI